MRQQQQHEADAEEDAHMADAAADSHHPDPRERGGLKEERATHANATHQLDMSQQQPEQSASELAVAAAAAAASSSSSLDQRSIFHQQHSAPAAALPRSAAPQPLLPDDFGSHIPEFEQLMAPLRPLQSEKKAKRKETESKRAGRCDVKHTTHTSLSLSLSRFLLFSPFSFFFSLSQEASCEARCQAWSTGLQLRDHHDLRGLSAALQQLAFVCWDERALGCSEAILAADPLPLLMFVSRARLRLRFCLLFLFLSFSMT
jgi:hypothetical protein